MPLGAGRLLEATAAPMPTTAHSATAAAMAEAFLCRPRKSPAFWRYADAVFAAWEVLLCFGEEALSCSGEAAPSPSRCAAASLSCSGEMSPCFSEVTLSRSGEAVSPCSDEAVLSRSGEAALS